MKLMGGLILLLSSGCTTVFYGSAMFPGGPGGCAAHCGQQGLQMSSFVYAGEYSTACICGPRDGTAPRAEATTAPAAAVVTMIRTQQAASQRHH
jgi:hypothetical protein